MSDEKAHLPNLILGNKAKLNFHMQFSICQMKKLICQTQALPFVTISIVATAGVSHTWLEQFIRVVPGEHLHNAGKKNDLPG